MSKALSDYSFTFRGKLKCEFGMKSVLQFDSQCKYNFVLFSRLGVIKSRIDLVNRMKLYINLHNYFQIIYVSIKIYGCLYPNAFLTVYISNGI